MPEASDASDIPVSSESVEPNDAEWTDDDSSQTLDALDKAVDRDALSQLDEPMSADETERQWTDAGEPEISEEVEWTDDSLLGIPPVNEPVSTDVADVEWTDVSLQDRPTAGEPTSVDETAPAAWTEDGSDRTPEASEAIEDTQAQPETELVEAELSDAAWTDVSNYQTLETSSESKESEPIQLTDDWDPAVLAWEEELTEPIEEPPQPTTTKEALSWVRPTWQRLQQSWRRLILGVRRRIPAAANLSDTVLSAILVGILVLLLILLNSVRQPSAARSPSPEAGPAIAEPTPGVTIQQPTEPQIEPVTPNTQTSSSPVPVVTEVDGERIAQIQTQLTDSSILNAQRVIDVVQADFANNQLTLIFNGDWYRLSQYDQTQLAQALMAQSESLAFADLQFLTASGEVIARSPVVGHDMVILQREPPPDVPIPEKPRYRIMIDR